MAMAPVWSPSVFLLYSIEPIHHWRKPSVIRGTAGRLIGLGTGDCHQRSTPGVPRYSLRSTKCIFSSGPGSSPGVVGYRCIRFIALLGDQFGPHPAYICTHLYIDGLTAYTDNSTTTNNALDLCTSVLPRDSRTKTPVPRRDA